MVPGFEAPYVDYCVFFIVVIMVAHCILSGALNVDALSSSDCHDDKKKVRKIFQYSWL